MTGFSEEAMTRLTWKRIWHFIWEDDSALSWVVNIILAFVLIKFIVYPGLGWVLGTSHPIVAVVSGSMEHDGSFDEWWSSPAVCEDGRCTQERFYAYYDIDKEDFQGFSFRNGFNTGDIIFLLGREPEKIRKGDVIVFQSSQMYPIIHRVIDIRKSDDGYVFLTKGDHNEGSGADDRDIHESRLIGRAVFRIPYLGWIKLAVVGIPAQLFKLLR
jgi:signal peptidase I